MNGQLVRTQGEFLFLYAHPALLLPPLVRPVWTAEDVADAFDNDLKARQVASGNNLGVESRPVEFEGGFSM